MSDDHTGALDAVVGGVHLVVDAGRHQLGPGAVAARGPLAPCLVLVQAGGEVYGPLERLAVSAVATQGVAGHAEMALTPFAEAAFANARVQLDDIDPAAWQPGAPQARLSVVADLQPQGKGIVGSFGLTNHRPGPLDQQRPQPTALPMPRHAQPAEQVPANMGIHPLRRDQPQHTGIYPQHQRRQGVEAHNRPLLARGWVDGQGRGAPALLLFQPSALAQEGIDFNGTWAIARGEKRHWMVGAQPL